MTLALAAVMLVAPPGQADPGVGPADTPSPPGHGFPKWYEDDSSGPGSSQRVVPCLDSVALCLLELEPLPYSFPAFFPDEILYWGAEALLQSGAVKVVYVTAVEGAFLNEEVEVGEQIVFGRVRVRARGLLSNKKLYVTHPYGAMTLMTDGRGRARTSNDDIGCELVPCDFTAAFASPVFESFLVSDSAPPGRLGDPAVEDTVTGSPTGFNKFRIHGPALPISFLGDCADLPLARCFETDEFSVLGLLDD